MDDNPISWIRREVMTEFRLELILARRQDIQDGNYQQFIRELQASRGGGGCYAVSSKSRQLQQAIELRRSGLSLRAAARQAGIAYTVLQRYDPCRRGRQESARLLWRRRREPNSVPQDDPAGSRTEAI
jgi:hypothetical protein